MSDYQQVRVVRRGGRRLLLEIEETHPDMDALSSIISGGQLRKGTEKDLLRIAAELLLESNSCDNPLADTVNLLRDDDVPAVPEELVDDVRLLSAEVIGESSAQRPLYRALLRIDLARDEFAGHYAAGMAWGTVASPAGHDFDDFLDHI